MNQECVATAKCPFIEKLNTLINISTNEDEKNALNEVINSRKCGGPSEETVCCEIPQGKCLYLVVFDQLHTAQLYYGTDRIEMLQYQFYLG